MPGDVPTVVNLMKINVFFFNLRLYIFGQEKLRPVSCKKFCFVAGLKFISNFKASEMGLFRWVRAFLWKSASDNQHCVG